MSFVDFSPRDGYEAPMNTCAHPWKPLLSMAGVLENDLFINYLKSQIHEKESLYISNLTSFLMTDIFPFRSQVFAQFPLLEITLTNNNDK